MVVKSIFVILAEANKRLDEAGRPERANQLTKELLNGNIRDRDRALGKIKLALEVLENGNDKR